MQGEWLNMEQAARHVGARRAGRPTLARTVRTWCLHGLQGVRLRSVMVGGMRVTTREWLAQFFADLAEARDRARRPAPPPAPAAARRRQLAAKRELEKLGAR